MESDDRKTQIIKAATSMEFYPAEITNPTELRGYKRIPMTEVSGLGAMFSEMIPQLRTVTSSSVINTKGLYRCTFPAGVSGQLAQFKDGSGYLGTIMNDGIVGQARWKPVNSVSSVSTMTVPVSPVSMFMAATLIEVNHKLDGIQKLGEEILSYQKEKDRFEMEANLDALTDTYNKFKYNLKDENWIKLKYNDVQTIKRNTAAQIKHLRSQIEKSMDKHDLVHSYQQTDQMSRKVQTDFQQYRMGIFMYSFATFLEVLLQGNFAKEYLDAICKDINDLATQYRMFYTDCYNKLEHSSKTTIESKLLKRLAKASDNAGRAIRNFSVVEKVPVDEMLIDAGKSMDKFGKKKTDDTLEKFAENMQSGAKQFVDGITEIGRLYNSPMDVLVDKNFIYLKLS